MAFDGNTLEDTKDIETILTILNPGLMVAKLLSDKFLLKTRFKNLTLRRTKGCVERFTRC